MIYHLSKRIAFKLITLCPLNVVRIFIYRYLFKYTIGTNVKIGKCVIHAKEATIGNHVTIGNHTNIQCNKLWIGDGTAIHSGNSIMGNASFTIGKNSRIINNHYIDLWHDVLIGNNTWLAGKGSQIWTHGSIHTQTKSKNLGVTIGDDIYIGSNSLIAPGVTIENTNLIGMGSVVNKSILTSMNLVAGNPATIIKENINWKDNW